jgi:molecular chaperone GrpE (heat shock protein)
MVVEVGDENEDGKILEELHRGYRLGEKVLRAAQVKVGRKG